MNDPFANHLGDRLSERFATMISIRRMTMKQPRNKSGQFAKLSIDVRFDLKVGPEDANGCWL